MNFGSSCKFSSNCMDQRLLEKRMNTQQYETWVSPGGASYDSSICDITPYGLLNFKRIFVGNTTVRSVGDYLQFGAP